MNDNLFEARLGDMVERCDRSGAPVFSNFLDERQCAEVQQWCRRNIGDKQFMLWGGFDEAARKMLAVYPDYCAEGIIGDFPLKCLTFTFREADKLSHRDFLGSFMALRLKREVIGDIITDEGIAQCIVSEVAASVIMSDITKIGRVGVKITDERECVLRVKQEFREICGTVASLRLDCVAALAARVSRENAAAMIRSERVDVNHITAVSVSQTVCEGDIISIRGSGRFIMSGVTGETKKGRIHICLRKYI